jgi:hypothetical protein
MHGNVENKVLEGDSLSKKVLGDSLSAEKHSIFTYFFIDYYEMIVFFSLVVSG